MSPVLAGLIVHDTSEDHSAAAGPGAVRGLVLGVLSSFREVTVDDVAFHNNFFFFFSAPTCCWLVLWLLLVQRIARSRRPWSAHSSRSQSVTISRSAGRLRGRRQRGSAFGFDEDLDEAAALPSRGCSISCSANTAWTARGAGSRECRRRPPRDAARERRSRDSCATSPRRPSLGRQFDRCRLGSSQLVIVALFALTCGVLAAAWMRGRLGVAALVLFGVAVVVWIAAFAAITEEFHGANDFATCGDECARCPLPVCGRVHRAAAPHLAGRSRDARVPWPPLARTRSARTRESRVVASSFRLPDLGEGLTEGEVARWRVAEGQEIAEDDPLVEIQTDKATVEIPSPVRRDGAAGPRRRGRRGSGRHGARRHRRSG